MSSRSHTSVAPTAAKRTSSAPVKFDDSMKGGEKKHSRQAQMDQRKTHQQYRPQAASAGAALDSHIEDYLPVCQTLVSITQGCLLDL